MFSSLQPSRPQVQHQQPRNPQYQQQTRAIQIGAGQPELVTAPRNQIEAMPPNQTTPHSAPPLPMYNPATMHPVFMMNNWKKTPFPLPINPAISPVAAGYVFPQIRPNMSTKL
ncbi:hypothetical protein Slin15195_G106120 [Septoria linicola]|uniref:Uncharacterized protein n=1 Tax=Septoria linicola TaxID=215465 RepID=A0A9Q9B1Q5_9PEZI|nr:hypothetical protein Slin15195_G106120 [Septoria linicola]